MFYYGQLVDLDTKKVIEAVMVSIMREPRTFTRENIVEINCQGGLVSVNKVLHLILAHGVRLANLGEFTKRAVLNGRSDLSQTEDDMDVIS